MTQKKLCCEKIAQEILVLLDRGVSILTPIINPLSPFLLRHRSKVLLPRIYMEINHKCHRLIWIGSRMLQMSQIGLNRFPDVTNVTDWSGSDPGCYKCPRCKLLQISQIDLDWIPDLDSDPLTSLSYKCHGFIRLQMSHFWIQFIELPKFPQKTDPRFFCVIWD